MCRPNIGPLISTELGIVVDRLEIGCLRQLLPPIYCPDWAASPLLRGPGKLVVCLERAPGERH